MTKLDNVLLTGASGFLGVHLLKELLTVCNVYAVVRSADKLVSGLLKFKIDLSNCQYKLNIIEVADLYNCDLHSFPDVDLVVHSAGMVQNVGNAELFQRNNVDVTMQLARHYKDKLVFISTLSVFVSSKFNYGTHEYDSPVKPQLLIGNYAKSKADAETWVTVNNGFIFRPGLLTPSTETGISFENSFFEMFVTALYELDYICPPEPNAYVDLTPVDVCSKLIIMYMLVALDKRKTFHIANEQSVSLTQLINHMPKTYITCDKDTFIENLSGLSPIKRTLIKNAFFKNTLLKKCDHKFNLDVFQSTGHYYGSDCFSYDNEVLLVHYIKSIVGGAENE